MNADQRKSIERLYERLIWLEHRRALRALLDAYDQTTANLSATQAHATALLERARAAEAVLAEVVRMWPGTKVGALAWMPVDVRDIQRARALIAARGTGQTPGAVEKTQHCIECERNGRAARDAAAERDEARADAAREHASALAYCKTATGYQQQIAALRQDVQRLEAELSEVKADRAYCEKANREAHGNLDEGIEAYEQKLEALRIDAGQERAMREAAERVTDKVRAELREERGKAWRAWRETALVEPLFYELGRHIAELIEGRLGGGR